MVRAFLNVRRVLFALAGISVTVGIVLYFTYTIGLYHLALIFV